MGRKIFVTYKYSDSSVWNLPGKMFETTVRHYVDELQDLIDEEDNINKGEADGESLEEFKDSTIQTKLKEKIFDSSITVIMISKRMKDNYELESDQWIPWEISYSLKEVTRNGRTSSANALLAVVLPDENNNDEYFVEYREECDYNHYHTERLFRIIGSNMFNTKKSPVRNCSGVNIYNGYSSYIHSVKWEDFRKNVNHYLDIAMEIRKDIDDYNIVKTI